MCVVERAKPPPPVCRTRERADVRASFFSFFFFGGEPSESKHQGVCYFFVCVVSVTRGGEEGSQKLAVVSARRKRICEASLTKEVGAKRLCTAGGGRGRGLCVISDRGNEKIKIQPADVCLGSRFGRVGVEEKDGVYTGGEKRGNQEASEKESARRLWTPGFPLGTCASPLPEAGGVGVGGRGVGGGSRAFPSSPSLGQKKREGGVTFDGWCIRSIRGGGGQRSTGPQGRWGWWVGWVEDVGRRGKMCEDALT